MLRQMSLCERCPKLDAGRTREIGEIFRMTGLPKPGTVTAHMSDRGISRYVEKTEWPQEKVDWFKSFVPGHAESEISAEHERIYGKPLTEGQIGNAKTRFGVKSGTHGGRFEKGSVPANKGRTWDEIGFDAEMQERMRKNCFKKGDVCPKGRSIPLGTERVEARDGYVEVKVSYRSSRPGKNDCWRTKHRLVWEEANGKPVPPYTMIVFADGDKRNFDPENLVAVPRRQWAVISQQGIPYWDAESLNFAMNVAKLRGMKCSAEKRPRKCKACGSTFEPRYRHQRTCDACLGRKTDG